MTPRKGYYKDLTGKKFGLWTVLSFYKKEKGKHSVWLCKCECGTIRPVVQPNLVGEGGSCGCNCGNWMTPLRKGWVENGVGYLPLTKGQIALVSPHRLEDLGQRHWFVSRSKEGKFYVYRWAMDEGGNRYQLHLARYILGLPRSDKRRPDHKNLDPLDNRDENIRPGTKDENERNKRVRRDSSTGVKGVQKCSKCEGMYFSSIKHKGIRYYLGRSSSIEVLCERYAEVSRRLHGEFGRIE